MFFLIIKYRFSVSFIKKWAKGTNLIIQNSYLKGL